MKKEQTLGEFMKENPSKVVIGEVRGQEAYDLMKALESGPFSLGYEFNLNTKKDFQIGTQVRVQIPELVSGSEDLDSKFNGEIATIVGYNTFFAPLILKFENEEVQALLEGNPRQFALYEVKPI